MLDSLVDQLEAGYPAEDFIFTGLRGMGKTVFLKEAQDRFVDRGWLCGYYEVRRGDEPGVALAQIIADTYEQVGKDNWFKKIWSRSPVRLGSVTLAAPAGSVSVSMELAEARRKAVEPYRDLYRLLVQLAARAQAEGSGVVFLVDEMQQFGHHDLQVLLQVSRQLEGFPAAIVGAGLPTLPELTSKAGTYAERFSFEQIDRLSKHEAMAAVTLPAAAFDVTFRADALAEILRRAEGHPYFLQLYASETWRAAGSPSDVPGFSITRVQVDRAVPEVQRRVDAGLYMARYRRASSGEREYLKAMASLGDDGVRSGAVAQVLGKKLSQLSVIRERLITKGIIHSPEVGKLDFSVPGFGDYVRRQAATED